MADARAATCAASGLRTALRVVRARSCPFLTSTRPRPPAHARAPRSARCCCRQGARALCARCAREVRHVAMSLCASPLHGSMHTSCGLRIMCVVVCAGHGGERRQSHHTSHCARPTAQLTRTPPSSHRWSGSARAASSSAAAVAAALLGHFHPTYSSISTCGGASLWRRLPHVDAPGLGRDGGRRSRSQQQQQRPAAASAAFASAAIVSAASAAVPPPSRRCPMPMPMPPLPPRYAVPPPPQPPHLQPPQP